MATFILPRALDSNGDPVSGALAKVYLADGTTPATTYSDEAMSTPNAWPIVYDAAGAPGACYVAEGEYKLDLQTSAGVSLDGYPKDDIAVFGYPVGLAAGGTGETAGPTLPTQTIYTSGTAQTYTTPSGCRMLIVECVGGGGGGGGVDGQGASSAAVGGDGGSGAYCRLLITSPAASYTYTVGAGGTGGTAGANNGSNGTATTFTDGGAVSISAGGGQGGTGHTGTASTGAAGAGGGGGTDSGGDDFSVPGSAGPRRRITSGVVQSYPTTTASRFGRTLCVLSDTSDGRDGDGPGDGGGGAVSQGVATDYAGGDGAAGIIRIMEYY